MHGQDPAQGDTDFRHSIGWVRVSIMASSVPPAGANGTVPMPWKHLLACLTFACAAGAMPLRAAEPAPAVAIELSPLGKTWEVRYALPHPAREMRFSRVDRRGVRVAAWTPVQPEIAIVLEDGEEVVRRTDGAAFDHVAFRMKPLYVELEKDYAPFSPFGDGGLLLHSGRFHACAERCAGGETWRLTVTPPPGAHAIVDGQVVEVARFEDGSDGTNVYVGRARPVETKDVLAVIDQAFPADARARLGSLLPKLMAFYGREFGALSTRPMLFASRDEAHPGGGYGFQGGTLPGQVFMHLYGRNEAFGTPAFAARMDWFFAHEAAHLYQGYPSLADAGDAWIHEGGADALAAVALQELGVIGREAVDERMRSSVDACATGIARQPLNRAHTNGAHDNFYACGFVMQMAVDAAARRASGGACGLACVWRDFQARVAAGDAWNTDTFAMVVARRADAATAGFVRTVATEVPPDPAAMLRDGLVQAGWKWTTPTVVGR